MIGVISKDYQLVVVVHFGQQPGPVGTKGTGATIQLEKGWLVGGD